MIIGNINDVFYIFFASLRAEGVAIHLFICIFEYGLPRRYAPRNDDIVLLQ